MHKGQAVQAVAEDVAVTIAPLTSSQNNIPNTTSDNLANGERQTRPGV